jgi:hypothetical protein
LKVQDRYAGYRSLFELNVAKNLIENKIKFEYETQKINYIPKTKVYTPDFYFPTTDIYVEAKGYFDMDDRVKMLLVKKQHPDLDIRFVFLKPYNKIRSNSKTTYVDWCNKYNFKWADKVIPMEWFKNV